MWDLRTAQVSSKAKLNNNINLVHTWPPVCTNDEYAIARSFFRTVFYLGFCRDLWCSTMFGAVILVIPVSVHLCCRTLRQAGLRRDLEIESILTNITKLKRIDQSQGLKFTIGQ